MLTPSVMGLVAMLFLEGGTMLMVEGSPLSPAPGVIQRLTDASGTCDPARAEHLIGKPFSSELAEDARRASHATSVRPMGPGIPSSADARSDRLNVLLDEARIVRGFRCG